MKKIVVFFFTLGITCCIAAFRTVTESFEGTIRYETSITGEAPSLLKERLTKYYELSFKGTDLKIKGGAPLRGEILLKKNLGKMYIVRTDQKNAYELDLKDKRIPENTTTSVVTRLKESITVAGYNCQKYQIQYGNELKLLVWTTPAINADQWGADQVLGGQFKLPDNIQGFPLKLQVVLATFTITCTATVVKSDSMDAMEFAVPNGLVTKKF